VYSQPEQRRQSNLADDGLEMAISLRGPGGETSLVAPEWTPLSLSGLSPGRYRLEAKLITAQGRSGLTHRAELMVQ
jgi:hypothetical protein